MIKQIISRIRRNHGLEHATIHILSENQKNFSAQGNSNHRGFYLNIYGDISEEGIVAAVEEAFTHMKQGEHQLAVHPNCGTVLLTTATMATLAAQAAFAIESLRADDDTPPAITFLSALPNAILASAIALIASNRLGIYLQEKYTTEGDLGEMQLVRIRRIEPSMMTRFFQVLLSSGKQINANAYLVETAG